MPNQSLVDLTERTATADTDLIHVNSGGTDYKQTKKNFTFDLVQYHEFNNTDTLTSQCDSLATSGKSPAYYVGKINSYGHQSATGVPFNNSYHVQLSIYSASYIELTLTDVDDGGVFRKIKTGGTWQSSWTMQPTRAEITALNNSLATKQDNLEWKLVYNGSIAKSSSYTHASNNSHTYLVVFGTWNFKGVYFVNPQNGGTPQVASVISTQACSFSASGTWGFTVNNVNTAYPMPVYIFQL